MFSRFTNSFIDDFEPESLFPDQSEVSFRTFQENEKIYSESHVIDKIYFLLKGKAEITRITKEGKLNITYAGKGDVLGLSDIICSNYYGSTSIAVVPVSSIVISNEYFLKMIRTNNEFRLWILKYLSTLT